MSKAIFVDFDKEQKKRAFKEKINSKFQKGKDWIVRNKEIVIALTPVVIGGVSTIVKVGYRQYNIHKEKSMKELYCYDRTLGHYWKLKRSLSNQEWVNIERRKNSGERLADILSELRVLK